MNEDKGQDGGRNDSEQIMAWPSSWPMGLASNAFSVLNFYILYLYGIVHWRVMMDFKMKYNIELPEDAKQEIYKLLGILDFGRVGLTLLALIWAIWAFRGSPLWLAFGAMVLALLAVFSLSTIM